MGSILCQCAISVLFGPEKYKSYLPKSCEDHNSGRKLKHLAKKVCVCTFYSMNNIIMSEFVYNISIWLQR